MNHWEQAKLDVAREHGYIDWKHMIMMFNMFEPEERDSWIEQVYLEVAYKILDKIPT